MVVLDVFIGLVFVYFLYSLFVSILAELFSTWIGMRARILRQGIENFLNDQQPKRHGLFMWLHDLFLVEHSHFRYSSAGRFYNEPTIKYLAKVGENKRYSIKNTKPAYIEKSHFVTAIVSLLIRRSIGINEWDKVKFSIENNAANLEEETLQMFKDWLEQSNDNYEKFKAYLGNSYEEVNDRLVGWYKRKIGVLLFMVGLILSFIMNVDTFDIVQTLADNPEKRMALVDKAIAAAVSNDSAEVSNSLSVVNAAYDSTKTSIDNIANILGSGWQNDFEGKNSFLSKARVVWNRSNPTKQKFWGFIITAFALSMGAKFWFDLLKRLVSLRGSGEKPDEHNINKVQTETNNLVPDNGLKLITSDPAKVVLSKNRLNWEAQPGFIAANIRYEANNIGFIELIFEEGRDIDNMPQEVSNPLDKDSAPVRLDYRIGTKGRFDQNEISGPLIGSVIQSTTRNWGTPAGIAFDLRTNSNVILTAGHVVRNDKTSFIDNTKSKILYKHSETEDPIVLGNTTNLVLSSFCDAGIIKLGSTVTPKNILLPELNKLRDVTFKDENKTKVKIHTLRKSETSQPSTGVEGLILSTRESFSFDDHPSPDIRFYDLFLIGRSNGQNEKPLTFSGDSGALITDELGNHLGILVGAVQISGKHYSFGIKMKDIFDILQLEPPKNEQNNLIS